MHVNWPGKKCVLCLKEAPLSKEHLIPKALGGGLTCSFLCRDCNSTLGAFYEAEAKADASIRIAAANLQSRMPALAQSLAEGQEFTSYGPGGNERGRIREREFRLRSRKAEDGSLIQPTDVARESVERILRKSDVKETPLADALRRFDEAQHNQKREVAPGLEIVKWQIEEIQADLMNNKPMSPLVPLKIGYEFLACHLGCAIYDDAAEIQELRTALINRVGDAPSFKVERLNAPAYRPIHGICFEGSSPYSRVQIRLFGWLAFRVHFRRLAVGGPRFIYTQYLDTGREDIRILKP